MGIDVALPAAHKSKLISYKLAFAQDQAIVAEGSHMPLKTS